MSKYGAKKVSVDGFIFDNRAEASYYIYLQKLKSKGIVKEFLMQKSYVLLEKFSHPGTGEIIRSIKYILDFEVYYSDGHVEIVDVKGMQTEAFKLKAKLFMNRYKIPLKLVKWDEKNKKFIEV